MVKPETNEERRNKLICSLMIFVARVSAGQNIIGEEAAALPAVAKLLAELLW